MTQAPQGHTLLEDAQALLAGVLMISLGVALFGKVGMVTGGTVGIAFLLHYTTGIGFGRLFFCINLPFIAFGLWRLGWKFTLRTFIAVALLSAVSEALPRFLSLGALNPVYGSVMGGLLVGTGLLILFRHQASLGGINILVIWLQERFGWRAGAVQLGLDALIIGSSIALISWQLLAISLLGALVMNMTLAINHKPGRYLAI